MALLTFFKNISAYHYLKYFFVKGEITDESGITAGKMAKIDDDWEPGPMNPKKERIKDLCQPVIEWAKTMKQVVSS